MQQNQKIQLNLRIQLNLQIQLIRLNQPTLAAIRLNQLILQATQHKTKQNLIIKHK